MPRKPKLGEERFLIEIISTSAVEAVARKQGWNGEDGVREFCEPQDAAVYWVRSTLDGAVQAAKDWLSLGKDFFGCVIIDREIFEQRRGDGGNLIKVPPEWERQESYEVAMDGEVIRVER